jgi:hypothetical protein
MVEDPARADAVVARLKGMGLTKEQYTALLDEALK